MREYISDLIQYELPRAKLSGASYYTLLQFASNSEFSTYGIYKLLKDTEFKSDYKNVHKKIRALSKANLIERTKTKDTAHNSKYYSITRLGVFCILSDLKNSQLTNRPSKLHTLIEQFGDDSFFTIFVYPYFNKKTLVANESISIAESICKYISALCERIEEKLRVLKDGKEKGGYYLPLFFFWSYLIDNTDDKLIDIIRTRLDVPASSPGRMFQKINDKTLMLSAGGNKIYLRLNKPSDKAFLTLNGEILAEYHVVYSSTSNKLLREFRSATFDEQLQSTQDDLESDVLEELQKLVYSVLFFLDKGYLSNRVEQEHINSLRLLARDKKFLKILEATKRVFDGYYTQFRKIAKTSGPVSYGDD